MIGFLADFAHMSKGRRFAVYIGVEDRQPVYLTAAEYKILGRPETIFVEVRNGDYPAPENSEI